MLREINSKLALNEGSGPSYTWENAIAYAKSYSIFGFSGFVLPSIEKQKYMYPRQGTLNNSLSKLGKAGFATVYSYWSSTEYDTTHAWLHNFDADQYAWTNTKSSRYRAWPIAYFKSVTNKQS